MKNTLIILLLLAGMILPLSSQPVQGDSLRTGRICRIVLYNGFQTEGVIRENKNDTLKVETEITNLYIPVKDIKFVMDTSIDVFEREEQERRNAEDDLPPITKADTTGKCDIYISDKTMLKDVKLLLDTDSTLTVIKGSRSRIVDIAGIRKIVFKPTTAFGYGYLYGSVIGFISGLVTFVAAVGSGHLGYGVLAGLICSIPAGILGGVVGLISTSEQTYLFDEGLYPAKVKRIKFLIEKHH